MACSSTPAASLKMTVGGGGDIMGGGFKWLGLSAAGSFKRPGHLRGGRQEIHGLDVLQEAGPETFSQQRYLVIPQLLDPALCSFFWSYVHTKFASRLLRADPQVPMTPGDYGDPAFDGLLEYLRPRVQDHSGLWLLPTYSYFRMYKRGDVLRRHRDRPACEISVTLNIGQKPLDAWPIYVQGEGAPRGAELKAGRWAALPRLRAIPLA